MKEDVNINGIIDLEELEERQNALEDDYLMIETNEGTRKIKSKNYLKSTVNENEKGTAGGVATLGEDGKIPNEQFPDDLKAVESVNGETGEVQIDKVKVAEIVESDVFVTPSNFTISDLKIKLDEFIKETLSNVENKMDIAIKPFVIHIDPSWVTKWNSNDITSVTGGVRYTFIPICMVEPSYSNYLNFNTFLVTSYHNDQSFYTIRKSAGTWGKVREIAMADKFLPLTGGGTVNGDVTFKNKVTATGGFEGNLTGTATKATQDGNGKNIANTYLTSLKNIYTVQPYANIYDPIKTWTFSKATYPVNFILIQQGNKSKIYHTNIINLSDINNIGTVHYHNDSFNDGSTNYGSIMVSISGNTVTITFGSSYLSNPGYIGIYLI